MPKIKDERPVVLVFAGHDPSGAAGLHADVETIAAHGCHAASVITMLTRQTIDRMYGFSSPCIEDFRQQANTLLSGMDIKAIKIGALGSQAILASLVGLLRQYKTIPIVLDPVLVTTSGQAFMDSGTRQLLVQELLPLVDVITPNTREAALLVDGTYTHNSAAERLLDTGCRHVLLTGTHDNTENVINRLYTKPMEPQVFEYRRLPGEYRGSGCILSSSLAAGLARGNDIVIATRLALDHTWACLERSCTGRQETIIPVRINRCET